VAAVVFDANEMLDEKGCLAVSCEVYSLVRHHAMRCGNHLKLTELSSIRVFAAIGKHDNETSPILRFIPRARVPTD
jgi:hypothetical protein